MEGSSTLRHGAIRPPLRLAEPPVDPQDRVEELVRRLHEQAAARATSGDEERSHAWFDSLRSAEERAQRLAQEVEQARGELGGVRLALVEPQIDGGARAVARPLLARLDLDALLRGSVLILLAGLLSMTVWAGVRDYALRVTSDTPTFIALVTGMAQRPFAEQSPFLAQQVATQHATPYMQAVAFLWSFLGGGERDPVSAGRLLSLVGIPVFALLLYSVFLYARRVAGSRAAWLVAPRAAGCVRPAACDLGVGSIPPWRALRELLPAEPGDRDAVADTAGTRARRIPNARPRVPRCGDDDARAPVLGRPALHTRNGPGLLRSAPRGARLLPGACCADRRLRARDDMAGVLARPCVHRDGYARSVLRRPLCGHPSSPSMDWRASSDRPRRRVLSPDCSSDSPRAVPRSGWPSSARSGRRSSQFGSWHSSTRRPGSRAAWRSTGWTSAGAGRSCSSPGRSASRGWHGSLRSGHVGPGRVVRRLPRARSCSESSASRFPSGTGSSCCARSRSRSASRPCSPVPGARGHSRSCSRRSLSPSASRLRRSSRLRRT